MIRATQPQRFDRLFCAMSTSLLLAIPGESLAFDSVDSEANAQDTIYSAESFARTRWLQGETQSASTRLVQGQRWRVDTLASRTDIDDGRGEAAVARKVGPDASSFSVEGGFAIGLGGNWVIEPQAQLINQQYGPGSQVPVTRMQAYDGQPGWSGRVGARLSTRYEVRGMPIEPYVRTSVWYDFSNAETVKLDQVDKISSARSAATVELGLGLVARVTPAVALFVSADYSSDVDDNDLNGLIGSLGVRMRW